MTRSELGEPVPPGSRSPDALPWAQSSARGLPVALRVRLAHHWLVRAWNERGAAHAFERLAAEIQNTGAPPHLVGEATSAIAEEREHLALCRRIAGLYADGLLPQTPPFPPLHDFPQEAPEVGTLCRIVIACCLSETAACASLEIMMAQAADPLMRSLHQRLLSDDIGHARLGWAYLALESGRAPERMAALARHLPALVGGFARDYAGPSPFHDPKMNGHGFIPLAAARDTFSHSLREVILPGFASYGFDTAACQRSADAALEGHPTS